MWDYVEAIIHWMGNNAEGARKVASWTRLLHVFIDSCKRLNKKENEPTCKSQVDSNSEKK